MSGNSFKLTMTYQTMTGKNELSSTGTEFSSYNHQMGQLRYKLPPTIIKSTLILGQTNAESECSLSVNARVVAKERALGENSIVGLHVVMTLPSSIINEFLLLFNLVVL